jgi:hypothetical protein
MKYFLAIVAGLMLTGLLSALSGCECSSTTSEMRKLRASIDQAAAELGGIGACAAQLVGDLQDEPDQPRVWPVPPSQAEQPERTMEAVCTSVSVYADGSMLIAATMKDGSVLLGKHVSTIFVEDDSAEPEKQPPLSQPPISDGEHSVLVKPKAKLATDICK